MSDIRLSPSKLLATFHDGTCWPIPGTRMGDIEWTLRHALGASTEVRVSAASVIAAYAHLIQMTQRERNSRVVLLRAAMKLAQEPTP